MLEISSNSLKLLNLAPWNSYSRFGLDIAYWGEIMRLLSSLSNPLTKSGRAIPHIDPTNIRGFDASDRSTWANALEYYVQVYLYCHLLWFGSYHW